MAYPEPVGGWRQWQCEVCGRANKSVALYFRHLGTHRAGQLAQAVNPSLGVRVPAYPKLRDSSPEVIRHYGNLSRGPSVDGGDGVSPEPPDRAERTV